MTSRSTTARCVGLILWMGVLLFASRNCEAASAASLAEEMVIRFWGTESGLPQNTVNAIVQSTNGYLWLGTRDGLARFDGVRFTAYGLRDGLQSVEILSLLEDRQGTLWIGTSGGGVSRLRHGSIETLVLPKRTLGGDTVTSLAEDAAGRIWIGTRAGLKLWSEGRFVELAELSELMDAAISALLRDRNGVMWIATATHGLFEFRNESLSLHRGPEGNESIYAYCLLHDREDRLWASVGNGTILCRTNGVWGKFDQSDGLPLAYVNSMAEAADGTIWAGSLDDGLYGLVDGHFSALRAADGLSGNDIRSLLHDREGNLWVGTRISGLNRLSRRRVVTWGAAQGMTNDFTRSVAESPDGTLWVGTTGGGLYRGVNGVFESFVIAPEVNRYVFVESTLAASDGTLWWGASRALFSWKDGRMTGIYTNRSWLRSSAVTALCEDRSGGIWIGTGEGRIVHCRNGKFTALPTSLARGPVTALAVETNGTLWAGSVAGGLNRIDPATGSTMSVTNGLQAVRTLYLDAAGSLWIGTAGNGLHRWRDGRMDVFSARQGLGPETVSQIIEDDFGFLWLGSNHGIYRVAKADLEKLAAGKTKFLHSAAYGVGDGMLVEECSSGSFPAGLKLRSGLLCFSTVKGLVVVDPRRQRTNSTPPRVLLEEVAINGRDGERAESTGEKLLLEPGERELEIRYTGINFLAPEKVRFRYRLDGLDRDWVEAGGRRSAYYHTLPAGDFTFRVIACNEDGVWSEPARGLAITIEPYLWEKPWFQLLASVILLGGLIGVLRLAEKRRFRRRLSLLEMQHAVEKERLRISKDMHDDIGGILTQISLLSELGRSDSAPSPSPNVFDKIGHQARAAVQGLDEIVWATNPKNDNLPRFAEYIGRFADEWFEPSSIRCWHEVPAKLPNLHLRADVRHNVFLAAKEAFNNVLKHSGATEVWLRISLRGDDVHLDIEDNGRGINVSDSGRQGNGLGNMRARLAESGGRMELTSGSGGTKIRFIFPLQAAPDTANVEAG